MSDDCVSSCQLGEKTTTSYWNKDIMRSTLLPRSCRIPWSILHTRLWPDKHSLGVYGWRITGRYLSKAWKITWTYSFSHVSEAPTCKENLHMVSFQSYSSYNIKYWLIWYSFFYLLEGVKLSAWSQTFSSQRHKAGQFTCKSQGWTKNHWFWYQCWLREFSGNG